MSRALALALLAAVLGGCASSDVNRIRRDLQPQLEAQAELGRASSWSFGRGSIGTTRFLGRLLAPSSTEPYRRLSGHVRRVAVSRSPITGRVDTRRLTRPASLARYDADGWLPLVTVRDSATALWVLYREDDRLALRDLLTVSVAGGELVVTRVSGDLSGLVLDAAAMSETGLFGGAFDRLGALTGAPAKPGEESD